jgi:hypothetical protein
LRHWLSENYAGRWNGRGRETPAFRPARPPDFTLFNSYCPLMGMIENPNGSASIVDNGEEIWRRIEQFASEMKKAQSSNACEFIFSQT